MRRILFIIAALIPAMTFAWGPKGHDTVAYIAEQNLSTSTLKRVMEVLEGHSLVYVANWMDNASHTDEYAYTKTWHYVNVDPEEGTYAADHFADDIDEDTKQARLGRLMRIQQRIAEEVSAASIGKTLQVVIDREEGNYYIGRTEYDSPEVDPEVLILKADNQVVIGKYYMVEITGADEFDLYGNVVSPLIAK